MSRAAQDLWSPRIAQLPLAEAPKTSQPGLGSWFSLKKRKKERKEGKTEVLIFSIFFK